MGITERETVLRMQSFLAHMNGRHPGAKEKSRNFILPTPKGNDTNKLVFGKIVSKYGPDGNSGYDALSGTFKAQCRGIYQLSATILCSGPSNCHIELVRGTSNYGTQILAVGRSKN